MTAVTLLTPSEPAIQPAGDGVTVEISVVVRAAGTATEVARDLVERIRAVVGDASTAGPVPVGARLLLDGSAPEVRSTGGRSTRRLRVAADPDEATLVLRTGRRTALLCGHPLTLTRLEYDLLLHLVRHRHQVLTREQLMRDVWGHQVCLGGRTVDVHIRRNRQKLAGRGPVVTTVHGVGYRLDAPERVRLTTD
ncbi:winged helix-turn-helix domain-containing protein [Micromonospora krabiensis]|uniref:Transcriptional regulatory protein, C terminal n=1 Tax=Micromonospora krabiensis TaxID=307121 RepID=A0A1C3N705_9ACTN|nr:winged helix-turn-helix domain-containing protein [Micromonospora krabiensis]SBV28364.1 Transcriptional regulatory protein, C terminal [Micromonospora krabiensis]